MNRAYVTLLPLLVPRCLDYLTKARRRHGAQTALYTGPNRRATALDATIITHLL